MKIAKRVSLVSVLVGFFCFTGCAYGPRVVSFDKEENTVSVQGAQGQPEEAMRAAAEKYCGGPAALNSMHEEKIGSHSSGSARRRHGFSSASSNTRNVMAEVYTYSCVNQSGDRGSPNLSSPKAPTPSSSERAPVSAPASEQAH